MALLQSTTISGSNANTGSLSITGSTMVFPIIESSLTGSFSGSGKMWVNADGQTLQYSVQTSLGTIQSPASFMGAWSAGGNMILGRAASAGAGTPNAALAAGGYIAPAVYSNVEEYNGSTWSAQNTLSTARHRFGGAGSQNAAVVAGGVGQTATEEYNGSSWSSGGAMITATYSQAFVGVQESVISAFGGNPGNTATTQIYNGSSWSTAATGNTARNDTSGIGTTNAVLVMGGNSGAFATNSELYDGTTWSNWVPILIGRSNLGAVGNTSNGLNFFGGNPTSLSCVEEWNGVSFVHSCNANFATRCRVGVGSQSAALAAGGYPSSPLTELYTKEFISPYTTCVWTNGAGIITARQEAGGTGTQNAALVAGAPTCVEEYDGVSWVEGGTMINGRTLGMFAFGTQNAAAVAGGYAGSDPGASITEEYNGSAWAAGGAMITGRYAGNNASGGTQNTGIIFSGYAGPASVACTEEYNGSAWASGGAMIQGRRQVNGAGIQNSALAAGGIGPGPIYTTYTNTEEYDGTTWTATIAMPTHINTGGASGDDSSNVMVTAGNSTGGSTTLISCSTLWDGISWSAQSNNLKQAQGRMRAGNTTSALLAGGASPSVINNTELFSAFCSTTLCTSLPVWSGVAPLLAGVSYGGGFGTQNAAVVATGICSPTAAYFGSQEYDGSTWTTGGTTNCQTGNGYGRAGAGTQNAGLLFGGWPAQTWTEKYDGSAWTIANAMINTAYGRGSSGTQNAALAAGTGPAPVSAATEEFNGTDWSAGGNLSVARYAGLSAGTQNDTVYAAGTNNSALLTATEEYNGSTWATGGSLSISSGFKDEAGFQMFGEGAYSAVITGGRTPTALSATEEYDGASWSARPQLPLALNSVTRIGTSNAGLTAGGRSPSAGDQIKNVYEYNNTSNVCAGIWSSGGSMNIARRNFGSTGLQTAALAFGNNVKTEAYDGSSWSTKADMITGRLYLAGAGTQNAALAFGGGTPGVLACTEEYDGSTWANGGAMAIARTQLGGTGLQDAGLAFGGLNPTYLTCTEEYNGSSWATGGAMIESRSYLAGAGTQNAGLAFGGNDPDNQCVTEEYNGSSWSQGGNLIIGRDLLAGAGIQNAALAFGGRSPYTASTEKYDGIAWSNTTKMLQARISLGGAGTQSEALGFGGNTPALTGFTEEYNCTINQALGAGLQSWIGKVNFVTE